MDPQSSRAADFFNQLAFKIAASKRAQAVLDEYLATGMNVVRDYVRPNENRISDVLKDLLDASGSHGQGSIFVDNFLKEVGRSDMIVDAHSAIIREHRGADARRLDLLIMFRGSSAIGIENKPFACDEENQVRDYCQYLQKRFSGGYVFYYVTPAGTDPPPNSIDKEKLAELKAAGKLRCISYQIHIREWLESCFKECKAQKVRWFLRDCIDFIDERFREGGNRRMPNDEHVLTHAFESESHLEVACRVRGAFDAIWGQIMRNFLSELEATLRDSAQGESLGKEWDIRVDVPDKDPETDDGRDLFTLWKKNWGAWRIALGVRKPNKGNRVAGTAYIGLRKPLNSSEIDESNLRSRLNSLCSVEREKDKWVAWCDAPEKPYGVWSYTGPQALTSMYFRDSARHSDMLSYFRDFVLQWTRTVSPFLDASGV